MQESASPRPNGDVPLDARDGLNGLSRDKNLDERSKTSDRDRPPSRSGSSSSRSTPSLKVKEVIILFYSYLSL